MVAGFMQKSNAHQARFPIVLGLFFILAWFSSTWAGHENIPCTTCHHRTEAQLKDYTYERSDFPDSTLCLSCHDADMDASGLNPPYVFNGRKDLAGGSFTPTLSFDDTGHNIRKRDRTLGLNPPGGGSLEAFECWSCHDAHDNGNFRNLKKKINGYTTPVEADGDPGFQQNVYVSGINDFCGACHEDFNSRRNGRGSKGWTLHPVGITISSADHADLEHWSRLANKVTQAEYPSGNPDDIYGAQVFCLSCHRAHASPYKNAMRWNHRQKPYGCLECHTF